MPMAFVVRAHVKGSWKGKPKDLRRQLLEMVGGVVKLGWGSVHCDGRDRPTMWPYVPPHYPFPQLLLEVTVAIGWCNTDAECK